LGGSRSRRLRYVGHANFHPIAHAIRNPVELMGAIASMTTGGVLERCVTELGAVAIIGTPNPVNGRHLHDEACEPLWAEIERLGVPVSLHPTGETSLRDDAGWRRRGSQHRGCETAVRKGLRQRLFEI
jgi:predicted TIM-barrel fold metal-dependent hydrolase